MSQKNEVLFDRQHYSEFNISDLIKWHGPPSIFRGPNFIMNPDTHWIPIVENLIFSLLDLPDDTVRLGHSYSGLKEIGSALLPHPPPWVTSQILQECFPSWRNKDLDNPRKLLDLDSDELFGAFILLAISVEANNLPTLKNREVISQVTTAIQYSLSEYIHWLISAYEAHTFMDKVQAEMNKCGFSAEQQVFAWRWVRKEIRLVEEVITVESN